MNHHKNYNFLVISFMILFLCYFQSNNKNLNNTTPTKQKKSLVLEALIYLNCKSCLNFERCASILESKTSCVDLENFSLDPVLRLFKLYKHELNLLFKKQTNQQMKNNIINLLKKLNIDFIGEMTPLINCSLTPEKLKRFLSKGFLVPQLENKKQIKKLDSIIKNILIALKNILKNSKIDEREYYKKM